MLLAQKGFVFTSKEELLEMVERGVTLYVEMEDTDAYHRAFVGKLHSLVREEKSLGQIAGAQVSLDDLDAGKIDQVKGPPDWLDLQAQANSILRDSTSSQFLRRLGRLQSHLRQYTLRNPDGALFALFHLSASSSASELRLYSATHAMLVSVMCGLAAREVLNWNAELEQTLCLAALTMNLSMTELQDRLALQLEPPSPAQQTEIAQHAPRSVQLLSQVGVSDQSWLEAVRDHHTVPPGVLAGRPEGQRLARLIQRADMFAARLAPRASRVPTSPAAAMQASYFDENSQVDEAGAALIKAVGIYSPGSYVRLSTNEVAVVIRRGPNTTTPRVAVVINREGLPTVEPTIRDTSLREYRIVASVPHRDVKVQLNLQRMLALTTASSSDRL